LAHIPSASGAGGVFILLGARRRRAATPALSADEKQALDAILRDG
jgi:hypothetical protein